MGEINVTVGSDEPAQNKYIYIYNFFFFFLPCMMDEFSKKHNLV